MGERHEVALQNFERVGDDSRIHLEEGQGPVVVGEVTAFQTSLKERAGVSE